MKLSGSTESIKDNQIRDNSASSKEIIDAILTEYCHKSLYRNILLLQNKINCMSQSTCNEEDMSLTPSQSNINFNEEHLSIYESMSNAKDCLVQYKEAQCLSSSLITNKQLDLGESQSGLYPLINLNSHETTSSEIEDNKQQGELDNQCSVNSNSIQYDHCLINRRKKIKQTSLKLKQIVLEEAKSFTVFSISGKTL